MSLRATGGVPAAQLNNIAVHIYIGGFSVQTNGEDCCSYIYWWILCSNKWRREWIDVWQCPDVPARSFILALFSGSGVHVCDVKFLIQKASKTGGEGTG